MKQTTATRPAGRARPTATTNTQAARPPGAADRPTGATPQLEDIPGIGATLAKAIKARFRRESEFHQAIADGDLQTLASVEGISERRAVELVRTARGQDADDGFLGTPQARKMHDEIIARIRSFAATSHGKNRLGLLTLTKDPDEAQRRMQHILQTVQEASDVDLDAIRRDLRRLRPLQQPPSSDVDALVVAGSEAARDRLHEIGVGDHAVIGTMRDIRGADQSLIVVAYDDQTVESGPGVEVPADAHLWELVPHAAGAWLRANQPILEACARLAEAFGHTSVATDILAITIPDPPATADAKQVAEELLEEFTPRMEEALQTLTLSGSDLMAAMSGALPKPVAAALHHLQAEARRRLHDSTGVDAEVFDEALPLRLDERSLDEATRGAGHAGMQAWHATASRAASRLAQHVESLEAEMADWLERDAELALAAFARRHRLQAWTPGDVLTIDDGIHLGLPEGAQPVQYRLGNERVALLTGANSGGKSTFLELVAQCLILARLGLPVPAKATLPWFDELHFVTARRGLDAGAFETFIKTFLPVCRDDRRRMVLADEVESMTELEAGGRILAHVATRLAATDSMSILVTHMAPQILAYLEPGVARIDGIEARGLDGDGRLVVDRCPRMGHLARSTPELIVERLVRKAKGPDQALFAELLTALTASKTRK